MSAPLKLRRTDRQLTDEEAWVFLERSFVGRLATVSADGEPYVVPLLFVVAGRRVQLHQTAARGHLRANVEGGARACFEVDSAGDVFAYGPTECDSSVSYESVIAFGRIAVVEDPGERRRFCERLLAKYGAALTGRPKGVFPRLPLIAVYELDIDRITGKRLPAPGTPTRG
ncbi:MAG TPA: pyridoxamine 5'-phosphate oxidase family protein [Caulobacteraceae bacterium]|nr:pyridoxamine 5'-phosphate oxidase family protein [Caulobacteraceae bacterium]